MRKIISVTIILFVSLLFSLAADPAEGFWLSVDDKTGEVESGWEFYQSNGLLLGKMLSGIGLSPNDLAVKCRNSYPDFPIAGRVNQLPILGTPWIFALRMESQGRWTNGYVIDPTGGSVYRCSVFHHPADGSRYSQETLEIRGYLLFFSGSQYWRRATYEEASSLR